MHGLLGGDVGNGEGAVERVANAAAAEHSSTEKRWEEEGRYFGINVHCTLKVWFSSSM